MNTNTWQLQEAKNHFSEVVAKACSQGAQTITKHGKPVVVVVAIEDFQSGKPDRPKKTLLEILRRCPDPAVFEQIEKSRQTSDFGRTIDLDE